MSLRAKQIVTGALALTGLVVGLWAAAWPRGFYDAFPGLGHHWVSTIGPFNEHLVRDVGGLYLGMAVISTWALARPRNETFTMVGLGWLVFNLSHAAFHLRHLDELTNRTDQLGNAVTLSGVVLLALSLLLPPRRDPSRTTEPL
ncbi:hypothetical protein [Nocardioides panacisoli]|uniref:DUF4383 domain-containing protein n=1 Tax=Nocardioides panacisoli TaxID=627624 RepID=A0ABP7I6J2_9ACTN